MSTSPNDTGKKTPEQSPVILLLGIAGDTTWRMFVPIIGLAVLGIWGDRSFGTKPWLTVVCLGVGVAIAGFLIKQQLQRNPKK